MQTISTKLDKQTAKKFLKVCNDEGKCQSEMLRSMIESMCELGENEEDLEIKVENVKPTIKFISEVKNPRIVFN